VGSTHIGTPSLVVDVDRFIRRLGVRLGVDSEYYHSTVGTVWIYLNWEYNPISSCGDSPAAASPRAGIGSRNASAAGRPKGPVFPVSAHELPNEKNPGYRAIVRRPLHINPKCRRDCRYRDEGALTGSPRAVRTTPGGGSPSRPVRCYRARSALRAPPPLRVAPRCYRAGPTSEPFS
jgi:hypothetical protein